MSKYNLLIAIFIISCIISAEPKWVKQAPANDNEFYYEVGACQYSTEDQIDSAKTEAIKQAKYAFYNNIASDFVKMLNKELTIEEKKENGYYAKYLMEFVYNSPIDTLIEVKDNYDFKQKKIYYILLEVPKQKFRLKIQQTIQERVYEINDLITELYNYINEQNIRKAFELLLRIYYKKESYFPGLAMTVSNLNELKGIQVDDYIRSNLNDILLSMVFRTDNDVIKYDFEGKLMIKPDIRLKFVDSENNETLNIPNMPVLIQLENGGGIAFEENTITTSDGKINVSNKSVKNDNSVYVMRFKIDVEKIIGNKLNGSMAEKFNKMNFPEKTIEIEPIKNIAIVAVNSVVSKTSDMSSSIYGSINDIIKTKQYLLYKLSVPKSGNIELEAFDKDVIGPYSYLIAVKSVGSVSEDMGMYYANVCYKCVIYNIATMSVVDDFTTDYSDCWGGSRTEAVNSALSKVKNQLFKKIDNIDLK